MSGFEGGTLPRVRYGTGRARNKPRSSGLALGLGYRKVLEYNEGLPAWSKASLPVAGSPLPAAQMASVGADELRARMESGKGPAVVDVRDAAGHELEARCVRHG